MSLDRLSKADLIMEVERQRQETELARQANAMDDEARAISTCVKALKPLAPSTSTGFRSERSGSIARVLHYLAQRYGVDL